MQSNRYGKAIKPLIWTRRVESSHSWRYNSIVSFIGMKDRTQIVTDGFYLGYRVGKIGTQR